MKSTGITLCFLCTTLSPQSDLLAKTRKKVRPRYYLRTDRIAGAGPQCGAEKAIGVALWDALSTRPELVVAPRGSSAPTQRQLKARRLKAFGLALRLLHCRVALKPRPPGKPYRILHAAVSLTLNAQHLPSGAMALVGKGDAELLAEVSRPTPARRTELLQDAVREALKRAVAQLIRRLDAQRRKGKRR